jgi:hypothetical protein
LEYESRDSLKRYYEFVKKSNAKVFEDYDYEHYLGYLFNMKLISEENGRVMITPLGVDFLKYLIENNKDMFKNF